MIQTRRRYTLEDKVRCAAVYIVTGSASKSSKITGFPRKTIADWTTTEWWSDLVGTARKRLNDELDALFTEGMHLGLENYLERLREGDPFKKRDDSIGFKPMTGKDCAVAVAVLTDKRTILRGDPTRITKSAGDSKEMDNLQKALTTIGEQQEEEVTKH